MQIPDISDLVKAEEERDESLKEMNEARQRYYDVEKKLKEVETKVVARYKTAGITEDECDHPVIKYIGLGEDECECCGLARPERKPRRP